MGCELVRMSASGQVIFVEGVKVSLTPLDACLHCWGGSMVPRSTGPFLEGTRAPLGGLVNSFSKVQ
jgi:hypothetical protein